jgi:hypothetical protein
MTHYLLSVHTVDGEVRPSMTEEEMRLAYQPLADLEEEMKSTGTWVFSGRLHDPDTATVVRTTDRGVLTTDGPFAESKDHLGGFYVIRARDLDDALSWASRVTAAVGKPIEVRPFSGTSED